MIPAVAGPVAAAVQRSAGGRPASGALSLAGTGSLRTGLGTNVDSVGTGATGASTMFSGFSTTSAMPQAGTGTGTGTDVGLSLADESESRPSATTDDDVGRTSAASRAISELLLQRGTPGGASFHSTGDNASMTLSAYVDMSYYTEALASEEATTGTGGSAALPTALATSAPMHAMALASGSGSAGLGPLGPRSRSVGHAASHSLLPLPEGHEVRLDDEASQLLMPGTHRPIRRSGSTGGVGHGRGSGGVVAVPASVTASVASSAAAVGPDGWGPGFEDLAEEQERPSTLTAVTEDRPSTMTEEVEEQEAAAGRGSGARGESGPGVKVFTNQVFEDLDT